MVDFYSSVSTYPSKLRIGRVVVRHVAMTVLFLEFIQLVKALAPSQTGGPGEFYRLEGFHSAIMQAAFLARIHCPFQRALLVDPLR